MRCFRDDFGTLLNRNIRFLAVFNNSKITSCGLRLKFIDLFYWFRLLPPFSFGNIFMDFAKDVHFHWMICFQLKALTTFSYKLNGVSAPWHYCWEIRIKWWHLFREGKCQGSAVPKTSCFSISLDCLNITNDSRDLLPEEYFNMHYSQRHKYLC